MNKLILSGRPTKDPEIKYSGTEEKPIAVARFQIASNRIFVREGEAKADFIPCVAFGRTAKFIEEYVTKGKLILITGSLRNNDYTDRNGQKVYGFQMVIDTIELLEKKTSEDKCRQMALENGDEFMELPDDSEVPFA